VENSIDSETYNKDDQNYN